MFDAQGQLDEIYDWISQTNPQAVAEIRGIDGEEINGLVYFYQTELGMVLIWSVGGLPVDTESCGGSVFAMHIHDGNSHYNPYDCPHPYHAGDLPPLFSNGGSAFGAVLTTRFGLQEILGKTVVIHSRADDFTSQPSGNAGEMIASGVIRKIE